jgi:hypothetical protein
VLALGEGGCGGTEGSVDISGDSGSNPGGVPITAPSLSSCDEAKGRNERLESLHVDEDDYVLFLNESELMKINKREMELFGIEVDQRMCVVSWMERKEGWELRGRIN